MPGTERVSDLPPIVALLQFMYSRQPDGYWPFTLKGFPVQHLGILEVACRCGYVVAYLYTLPDEYAEPQDGFRMEGFRLEDYVPDEGISEVEDFRLDGWLPDEDRPLDENTRVVGFHLTDAGREFLLLNEGGAVVEPSPPGPPPVFDSVRETLCFDGDTINLEGNECLVLALLIEKSPCPRKQLQKSGIERPERILAKLLKKYPALKPFITLPGAKGKGGYRTTISLAQ
jgi:hypothetical protein